MVGKRLFATAGSDVMDGSCLWRIHGQGCISAGLEGGKEFPEDERGVVWERGRPYSRLRKHSK